MPEVRPGADGAVRVGMPSLVVVGTGRSGTRSLAHALRGVHEPNMHPTVYLAMCRSHHWLSDRDIARFLAPETWPDIIVDYKQSELIDITAQLWDARYLWVTRNPADAVASMVAKRWYLPSDDQYPPGYLLQYRREGGQLIGSYITNDSGNRTRGDLVGEFSFGEWSQMSQVERCGWWWGYCSRAIAAQFQRLDDDRYQIMRLEEFSDLPELNTSHATPVAGWERYTKEMADWLGYS